MRRAFCVVGIEVADEPLEPVCLKAGRGLAQKRARQFPAPGLDEDADAKPLGLDPVGCRGRIRLDRDQVFISSEVSEKDAPAVQRQFKLMRPLETANGIQVGSIELDLDVVLAVHRKRVAGVHAANRTDGQPFEVLVL